MEIRVKKGADDSSYKKRSCIKYNNLIGSNCSHMIANSKVYSLIFLFITAAKFKTPQRIMYIEELCEILTYNLPDLWKLGQAYFSGSIIIKEVNKLKFIM